MVCDPPLCFGGDMWQAIHHPVTCAESYTEQAPKKCLTLWICTPMGNGGVWQPKGRATTARNSTAPTPIVIDLTFLLSFSLAVHQTHSEPTQNSDCHKSTLFSSPVWRLLSREYIISCVMHGWSNSRTMTMFSAEPTGRQLFRCLCFAPTCHMLAQGIPDKSMSEDLERFTSLDHGGEAALFKARPWKYCNGWFQNIP